MKARLIYSDGVYQLLVKNGTITTLAVEEAKMFLLEFDNEDYYSAPGVWDYEISMAGYKGDTIAFVDLMGQLCVANATLYRNVMTEETVCYLTAVEFAKKHGRQPAIVRRLCADGRIKGAILKGRSWLIPENAPYPVDARLGSRIERFQ